MAPTGTSAQRSRRRPMAATNAVMPLPREVEMAYIYADLRRLIVIAGALLAMMLVILFIVER